MAQDHPDRQRHVGAGRTWDLSGLRAGHAPHRTARDCRQRFGPDPSWADRICKLGLWARRAGGAWGRGGYDQGRLLPQTFGSNGFHWISVSRFGYLRSAMPDDASTRAQAEAFADLLDELNIDRVAILAMSGGVPPALQFAELYPERTTALVLLSSAPFTPLTADQQDLPIPAWVYQALFRTDFVFWALTWLSPSRLDAIFDISPKARARMTEADRTFASGLIQAFLPVTARTSGLRNEGAAVDPGANGDLAKITAPTLVVHARDDGINPFAVGEYTAQHIPGATFMVLDDGGHILLGHLEAVRDRVTAFLRQHTGAP